MIGLYLSAHEIGNHTDGLRATVLLHSASLSASVAQLAEHALRKRMVMGSIPIRGFLLRESDNICVRVWDCKDLYTLQA